MVLKVAAEQSPKLPLQVVVREYVEDKDKEAVVELENRCEVGQKGLVTDLMGDPICRVRHFQTHIMLVSSSSYLYVSSNRRRKKKSMLFKMLLRRICMVSNNVQSSHFIYLFLDKWVNIWSLFFIFDHFLVEKN